MFDLSPLSFRTLIFLFKRDLFIFIFCVWLLYLQVWKQIHGDKKKVPDALKLELRMTASCHVGAENRNWVCRMSNKHFYPLSHSSSHWATGTSHCKTWLSVACSAMTSWPSSVWEHHDPWESPAFVAVVWITGFSPLVDGKLPLGQAPALVIFRSISELNDLQRKLNTHWLNKLIVEVVNEQKYELASMEAGILYKESVFMILNWMRWLYVRIWHKYVEIHRFICNICVCVSDHMCTYVLICKHMHGYLNI